MGRHTEDWVCPICGASKEEFRKEEGAPSVEAKPKPVMAEPMEDEELTPLEMSILVPIWHGDWRNSINRKKPRSFELGNISNRRLHRRKIRALTGWKSFGQGYGGRNPAANAAAADAGDRGAKRALVWSEKVTRILKSLLARYQKEGEAFFENTNVYVCTICGFVYIGDILPDVCPVCKVPNWKFENGRGCVHV